MSDPKSCDHVQATCLNQHEFIRKYCCDDCGAVMMCACDETFGQRFLAHQLFEGCKLENQERVPVTHGFQPGLCNGCRGLPLMPSPCTAIHGRTSKIRRFYWRELFFRETEAFADWETANPDAQPHEVKEARKRIEGEVLDAIKALHASAPLYEMREPSSAELLAKYEVDVDPLHPEYAASPEKGAVVMLAGEIVSPEAYVAHHYAASGWSAMPLESAPFHALYAVMLWLLIEHPSDPKSRMAGFGSRSAFEAGVPGEQIWMHLPEDFGTPGYGWRRAEAIDEHFKFFFKPDGHADRGSLLELFDYWRVPSERLRQYLWAHRDADVHRAQRLIELLPADTILAILRYLVDDYWGRYLGWPDLLLHRNGEFMLVEVKSSSDKLSGDQMRWITDNHAQLKLPFRLAKLHRPSRQARRGTA
jgi:hypothetical protein